MCKLARHLVVQAVRQMLRRRRAAHYKARRVGQVQAPPCLRGQGLRQTRRGQASTTPASPAPPSPPSSPTLPPPPTPTAAPPPAAAKLRQPHARRRRRQRRRRRRGSSSSSDALLRAAQRVVARAALQRRGVEVTRQQRVEQRRLLCVRRGGGGGGEVAPRARVALRQDAAPRERGGRVPHGRALPVEPHPRATLARRSRRRSTHPHCCSGAWVSRGKQVTLKRQRCTATATATATAACGGNTVCDAVPVAASHCAGRRGRDSVRLGGEGGREGTDGVG